MEGSRIYVSRWGEFFPHGPEGHKHELTFLTLGSYDVTKYYGHGPGDVSVFFKVIGGHC